MLLTTHLKGKFLYQTFRKFSHNLIYFAPHFFLCFLCSFCLLFAFHLFLFSPLLSVAPLSSPPFLCLFCLQFPFYSPPYSFLHFLFLSSLFLFILLFVLLCLHLILLFPLLFSYVRLPFSFSPPFYSSRLTVASHIPRILCSFCPLTAVCSREDPQDISSLVLFPSSLHFLLHFLSVACLFFLLSFSFFLFLVLKSLLVFGIPYSFLFSFMHLFLILPPLNLFYFPLLKIITSLSFPFFIPIFYFILLRTHFCSLPFIFFSSQCC